MREKIMAVAASKGYKLKTTLKDCVVMAKSKGELVKVLLIYRDKMVVQEVINFEKIHRVGEIDIERAEYYLNGGKV